MQTLNQHINLFESFANGHKQINSFGVGELWELTEKDGDRVYPILWTVIEPDNVLGNELINSYTFVFADIVDPDEADENEILSDEKQKALDLLSFLRFSDAVNSETILIKSATITPFTEKFEDNLAGWILTVQLKQAFIYNYCDAPVTGISPASPLCRPVSIYKDGVFEQTVASGGRFDYSSATGSVSVSVNSTAYDTVTAPGTLNIPVVNTLSQAVGTVTAGVKVEVQNGLVQVNNQDVLNTLPESTVGIDVLNSADTPVGTNEGGGIWRIADDIVTNTDASVTFSNIIQDVPKVLPDVTMTQPNGSTTPHPSMKNFSCTQIENLATQDLNDQLTPTQINQIQRQQPTRTGQTTSFRTGDDGDLELGIGASFSTLSDNNIWGNTNRFTDDTGAQTYTNNFVLDHLTGLMWYRVPVSGTWNQSVDGGQSSTQGGFTDWFLPNVNQIQTILNYSQTMITNYSPFNININSAATRLWISTTDPAVTTSAFSITAVNFIQSFAKTNVATYIICRRFIPSDFGL